MDKTMQYLSMCKKAEDLQNKIKESLVPGIYMRWYDPADQTYHESMVADSEVNGLQEIKNGLVILFTQEQLQKLFASSFPSIDILERMVFDWRWEKDYWTIFETFEQLWLAFLMKERYKMVWNKSSEIWIQLKQ